MRLELLGPFRLTTDTGVILITAAKQKALLAYLACTAPRPQPRDQLIELLWGGRFETQARQSLRQAVSKLRQAVGANVIVNDHGALTVDDELLKSDYAELQRLTPARSAEAAQRIAGLWQGEFLQDLSVPEPAFETWLETERRRVREAVVEAIRDLAAGENERGNAKSALAKARTAVALEPFRDDLRRVVMEAFWRSGRGADALRHFDDYAGLLERELQAKPEAETRALAQRIRSGEPALVTPAKEQNWNSASAAVGREAARNANDREGSQSTSAGVNELKKRQSRSAAASARRGRRPLIISAAVAASLIIGATVAWLSPWQATETLAPSERPAFPLPDKASLAVLPFENLSADPEQEYFADGITEDLITDLSKVSGLFVIARDSSFAYKEKSPDAQRVAHELGVRYVLEGSVRRAADQIRLNARLIDASTGEHLWAERYDGTLDDVFAVQDALTRRIVGALAVELTPMDIARTRKGTEDVQAYEAYLRGWTHFRHGTREDYVKAREYLEKAEEHDPDYPQVLAALAGLYWEIYVRSWNLIVGLDTVTTRNRAKAYLEKALAEPTPLALQVSSEMLLWYGKYDEAISEAEKALALDASNADSHVTLAENLIWSGSPAEALDPLERARRLDPHNEAYHAYVEGLAKFVMSRLEEATVALERALDLNPGYVEPAAPLAAAYAHLGRIAEAQKALKTYCDHYGRCAPARNQLLWYPFRREEDRTHLVQGLIRAGLEA